MASFPPRSHPQRDAVVKIEHQASKVRALDDFLRRQESVLGQILSKHYGWDETAGASLLALPLSSASPPALSPASSPAPSPASASTPTPCPASASPSLATSAPSSARFLPSYQWQFIPEGVTGVPPGLQVDLPLDGRQKRARIPPTWQLQVWLGYDLGYWRYREVSSNTTALHLRRAAAAFADAPVERVRLRLAGAELGDHQTAEELNLFGQSSQLAVVIV